MIVLLRFLGLMNAAVWFGAAVLFLFGITPATVSADMSQLLKGNFPSYSGIIGQVYWERFLVLQIWCGAVALVHQVAEWLYLGRRLQRLTFWLVLGLLALAAIDGLLFQPHLQRLQQIAYAYRKTPQGYESHNVYTPTQRIRAVENLAFWQKAGRFLTFGLDLGRISLTVNWLALGGLGLLTWRLANPVDTPRFIPASKFRS